MAQCQTNSDVEAREHVGNTQRPYSQDAGFVAIADGPANEVGMRLAPERRFCDLDCRCKCRGMRRMLEGMKDETAVTVRQVQFAG